MGIGEGSSFHKPSRNCEHWKPHDPRLPPVNGISEPGMSEGAPREDPGPLTVGEGEGRRELGGHGVGVGGTSPRPCFSWEGEYSSCLQNDSEPHTPLGWVKRPDPYPGNAPPYPLGSTTFSSEQVLASDSHPPHGFNNSASIPTPFIVEGAGGWAQCGHPPTQGDRETEQEESLVGTTPAWCGRYRGVALSWKDLRVRTGKLGAGARGDPGKCTGMKDIHHLGGRKSWEVQGPIRDKLRKESPGHSNWWVRMSRELRKQPAASPAPDVNSLGQDRARTEEAAPPAYQARGHSTTAGSLEAGGRGAVWAAAGS